MKKRTVAALLLIPLLTGCALPAAERREVEQLRVIQTLGADYAPEGLRLSLAAAAPPGVGEPEPCLSGSGRNFSAALEQIRARSVEEELFTGHVRALLLGEEAAVRGLDDLLGTVCRSADLRLDMPLYLVRDGTAEELMNGVGSGGRGVTEVLQAAELRIERQRGARGGTAAELLRSLSRSGGGLLPALRYEQASESEGRTAAPAGLGVIKDGKLLAWIEEGDCLGADLLRGSCGSRELSVRDLQGLPASLELQRGETRLVPVWNEDGSLRGVDVLARVRAAVLETAADSDEGGALYDDYLTAQLEAAISETLSRVLSLERQLALDFLDLGSRLELAAPTPWRALGQPFGALLPALEISITVRGELSHRYDAKEA